MPSPTDASPWVQKTGKFIVSGRFDFQLAEREFLGDSDAQPYPLNGTYQAAQYVTSIRFGLVPDVELQLEVPLQAISYTADPVILLPNDEGGLDYYQENTIDLSESVAGVGDLRLTARYQLVDGAFATAFELGAKLPTGYEKPAGTFGAEPKSKQDFRQNIGTYVAPDNVQDDVTLGDGQVDLDARLLLGWALPSRTFLRFDAGYKLRLRGGGDQVVGRLKVGQQIGERVLLFVSSGVEYAVQDGDVVGVSVAAKDPTLPADEYGGTKNLKLRERRLDHDRLSLSAGTIVRISKRVEATVSYSRVVWGRNTALVNALSLGVGVKFDATPSDG